MKRLAAVRREPMFLHIAFQHGNHQVVAAALDYRQRGARVARTRIGESWLVLVSPYDPASVPGRYLAEHGEGFFLLSLGYEDIVQQLGRLEASDVELVDQSPRDGILDWRVADIGDLHGAKVQLTDDTKDETS